jgi:hypothetical protein
MIQYKNPNYWFLIVSALIMMCIAVTSYYFPDHVPFATEGAGVKLYRFNYALVAAMVLLTNNLSIIRGFLILSGWLMIYFVVATWLHFPPDALVHFTKKDNILHTNLGIISIFVGVIYGAAPQKEAL